MNAERLDEYPEAVPMRRISQGWRIAAIFLGFAALGLSLVVLSLISMISNLNAMMFAGGPGGPGGAWPTPPTTVVENQVDEDDLPDAASLPYPVAEDVRKPTEEGPSKPSARDRFLNRTKETWKAPSRQHISSLAVSPDGTQLSYIHENSLIVGPFNAPQAIDIDIPARPVAGRPAPTAGSRPELRPVGEAAWSGDGQFVYLANAGGQLLRVNVADRKTEVLPFRGMAPAPFPNDPAQLVFVRSNPTGKVDSDTPDPRELVVGNLDTKAVRVVVPAGPAQWLSPRVSPDGKKLAVVSDHGQAEGIAARWRVLALDLANGTMEAGSPADHIDGPIRWTPDGNSLVYARRIDPLPADCRDEDGGLDWAPDLCLLDLATRRETRLSRGGGFSSPSVAADGELFFLTHKSEAQGSRQRLRQLPVESAQRFADGEKMPPARGTDQFTALLDKACVEAKVPADADGTTLTPALLAALDEAFRTLAKDHFGEEVADTPKGLDRLARELHALSLDKKAAFHRQLVLGALQGEHLRRRHGAVWNLSAGPLHAGATGAENEFACAANPFPTRRGPYDETGYSRCMGLTELLSRARGRSLLLANDPAIAKKTVADRLDATLAEGTDALKAGNAAGEGVLIALVEKEANQGNRYLALEVGKKLYEYQRLPALKRLMQKQTTRDPGDPALYNLLGLALLDADSRQAQNAFKKALRCKLHYEPAYVNLASAFEKAGDVPSAKACLRRYLDLFPHSSLAADVALRLGRLEGP